MSEIELYNVGQMDRSKYIGSSDVAAILGISPWRTPLDVYLDKVQPGHEEIDPGRLKAMIRGKRLEPYVLDILSDETGLRIVRMGQRYRDREFPFIAAEIDGEADSGENIEIKTVSPFKAREWGEQYSDEVPLHYAAQAMHALMVTGRDLCVFGVLIGGDDFRIYHIQRDDTTIAAIRKKEVAFWDRIQNLQPPEATTVEDILRLYGYDAGTAICANAEIEACVIALREMRDEAKRLDSQIDLQESRIKMFMKDSTTLLMNGAPVITWKSQKSNRIDTAALKTARPEIAAEFTKRIESRVFRIK